MWNFNTNQLKYLSFYYFWLLFLPICTAFDFYMDTITGFTFGYIGAFIYMWIRFKEAQELLKDMDSEEEQ
jgi:hypothetical protein